jgi:hypothetical protein
MTMIDIKARAKYLAAENKLSGPDIERIYWFPSDAEVRLIALTQSIPKSSDGHVHPYYFRPSPQDQLPAPSGIALIRPDEFGSLSLPEEWGDWKAAVAIEEETLCAEGAAIS